MRSLGDLRFDWNSFEITQNFVNVVIYKLQNYFLKLSSHIQL